MKSYDGNGVIEAFTTEVKGLNRRLVMALPPVGIDSVAWQLIRTNPDSVRLKKAFYNYLFVKYEASNGIHNPKYAIDLLRRSITVVTGVGFDDVQGVPSEFTPWAVTR